MEHCLEQMCIHLNFVVNLRKLRIIIKHIVIIIYWIIDMWILNFLSVFLDLEILLLRMFGKNRHRPIFPWSWLCSLNLGRCHDINSVIFPLLSRSPTPITTFLKKEKQKLKWGVSRSFVISRETKNQIINIFYLFLVFNLFLSQPGGGH